MDELILVTSGNGKTGSRVAERLRDRGAAVAIGSRSATPPFHWHDPSTWAAALDGASAAYVAYVPDLAVPGAPEAIGAFADLAVESGTRRLVPESFVDVEDIADVAVAALTEPRDFSDFARRTAAAGTWR